MHLGVQYTFTVNQYTEKVQKLRNWTVLVHYHIAFFAITHANHSLHLFVWFDFFQTFMSTTSSPPSPLDSQGGTVPVTEVFSDPVQIAGFTGKSSLKVKLKQEEGVQGPKVYTGISQSAQWTSSLVKILISISHSRFSISHFTVNCLQEAQLKIFFASHSNIMHIIKVHRYYM